MKSLRYVIGVVLAFALAAFAMPGFAQNKSFFLGATAQIDAGTSKTVLLTFKNNEAGNSSFNSVSATGTPGSAVTITAASTSSPKKGNVVGLNTNKVTITDLSPTKGGETLTVTLTVTATAGNCTNGVITWTGSGWTGSPSTPSNPFTQLNSGVTTTVKPSACLITFSSGPTDAYVNQVISNVALTAPANPPPTPVRVTAIVNGAAVPANTDVTLTSQCDNGTLTFAAGSLTAKTNAGVAEFGALKSSTTGTGCSLTATVPTYPALSSTTSSPKFNVKGKLVFSPLPTSIVPGVPSTQNIVVSFVDVNGSPIPAFTGSVNLEVVVVPGSGSTCTLPNPTFVTATGGVATFAGLIFGGTPGSCTVKVFATIDGTYYEQTSSSFKTYAGVLNCNNDPTASIIDWTNPPATIPPNQFDGSPLVNQIGAVTYYKGARGENDISDPLKPTCVPVNYTVINNIGSTTPNTTGQSGKVIPPNGAALFWDDLLQPNATFRVVTTFADEWTDASGWIATRTKVCLNDGCTETYPLKACLGIALIAASVPVYGSDAPLAFQGKKMPGCIVGEVWTTVVPAAGSPCLDPLNPPPSPSSACVRATSETLFIGDPVFIR